MPNRLAREKNTVEAMIRLYCRDRHGGRKALCDVCLALCDYALARLDRCPFGEKKPKCSSCTTHCYEPAMRERIREVMRYSGPRMILHRPHLALLHMLN